MTIIIQNDLLKRRARITTLFIKKIDYPILRAHQDAGLPLSGFAYCKSFGQSLKCVVAGRMKIVKSCRSLPSTIFGKRKGPFLKLVPADGWYIVDYYEEA